MFTDYTLYENDDIAFFVDGRGRFMKKDKVLMVIEKLKMFYENPIFDIEKENEILQNSYKQKRF